MGAIGSPVVLITASHEGRNNVLTANMIAGLSFKPPLICVSLSHHSLTRELVDKSGQFAVNIISPEQLELAEKIGSSTGRALNKFEEFGVDTTPAQVVACPLIKEAHTALECTVERTIDIGTHNLYIAEIVAYRETKEATPLYLFHGSYYAIGEYLGQFYGK